MLKRIIKAACHRLGYEMVRSSAVRAYLPDPFEEMRRLIPEARVIFDVGAHHGHVSLRYRQLFPLATVYAFEPFPDSFAQLSRNTSNDAMIRPFNFGLADTPGPRLFSTNASSATNSIFETDARGSEVWGKGLLETSQRIPLPFSTIDQFLADSSLAAIDILKLDVQGAEYLVLQGARRSTSRIKLIYSEIITQPTYQEQQALHDVLRTFQDSGFLLHNFYELSRTTGGKLRQLDAIFANRELPSLTSQ